MADRLRVSTSDGKYTIIQEEIGNMSFLRHGQVWEAANNSDWKHAGMILALAQELEEAQNIMVELLELRDRTDMAANPIFDRALALLPKAKRDSI